MIKHQIKDLSIQKVNSVQIPYAVLFLITCLQTLGSKKIPLLFSFLITNAGALN